MRFTKSILVAATIAIASPALAADLATNFAVPTVATSNQDIALQRGNALPGSVRWSVAPTTIAAAAPDAAFGVGATGALTLKAAGLATDAHQVHAQGGNALPGSVRWTTTPDRKIKLSQLN